MAVIGGRIDQPSIEPDSNAAIFINKIFDSLVASQTSNPPELPHVENDDDLSLTDEEKQLT